jgi:hypothetical protein
MNLHGISGDSPRKNYHRISEILNKALRWGGGNLKKGKNYRKNTTEREKTERTNRRTGYNINL